MHRLIKLLFWVSDILAWLLIVFSAFAVVAYPIFAPALAKMEHQQLASSSIVITCLLWLSALIGAALVTRRRVSGLVLIVAAVFLAVSPDHWLRVLPVAVIPLLVFGLPFLLILFQAHSARLRSAP